MLLPIGVVHPNGIRALQIVLLNVFQEMVDRVAAAQRRVPVPGPIGGMARYKPKSHNQNEQEPAASIKHGAIAPFAGFVILRSIEQGHRRLSSQSSIRQQGSEVSTQTHWPIQSKYMQPELPLLV